MANPIMDNRQYYIDKFRAIPVHIYSPEVNLIINLFHRDKCFSEFVIFNVDIINKPNGTCYIFVIKGHNTSSKLKTSEKLLWKELKKIFMNILINVCCICEERNENMFNCNQCFCAQCISCFSKQAILQKNLNCPMCRYKRQDNDMLEKIEIFDSSDLTLEQKTTIMVNSLNKCIKRKFQTS